MCLYTKTNVAKIAKTDLYVIKQFSIYTKWNGKFKLKSPYREFFWNKNIYYNASLKIELNKFNGNYNVNEGLHAFYQNNIGYGKLPSSVDNRHPLYICKIPKGSEYYLGMESDIVSNKMKIVEIGYEVSKYSPVKCVDHINVFKKAFKKLEKKYGKQNY